MCTSRSPTVGISFWCLPRSEPSGPRKTCELNIVPSVPGSFSQTPTTQYASASRAAACSASISGPGISTAFLNSSTDSRVAMRPVAEWKWNQTGWAGMNPSGKAITRAPLAPASRISAHAFSVDASRSRKTEAAWTAAALTVGYASPIGKRWYRRGNGNRLRPQRAGLADDRALRRRSRRWARASAARAGRSHRAVADADRRGRHVRAAHRRVRARLLRARGPRRDHARQAARARGARDGLHL